MGTQKERLTPGNLSTVPVDEVIRMRSSLRAEIERQNRVAKKLRHDPRYVDSDDPSAELRAWAHGRLDMGGWAGPPSTEAEFLAAIMDELAYAGVVGDYVDSDGDDLSTAESDIRIELVEAEEGDQG